MDSVCEVCGSVGFETLLLFCHDCNRAMHQYCLAKIIYDASVLKVWWCHECQPRHGKVTYQTSLYEVPKQKQPSHVHSVSGIRRPSTMGVESTTEAAVSRKHKNEACKSKSKSRIKMHSSRCDAETQRDINGNITSDLIFEKPKKKVRFQLDNSKSNNFRSQNIAVNVPQPSTLQKTYVDRAMLSSTNKNVVTKESNNLPPEHVKVDSPKNSCAALVLTGDNESDSLTPPGQAYSGSFSEITSKAIPVLEDNDTDVELTGAVQTCVKDNLRKRKQPILLDNENEGATDVQTKDSNHQSLKHDVSMTNHIIDIQDCVQEVVLTGDSNGQNFKNGRQVKSRKHVKDIMPDILIPESSEFTSPAKKLRCIEAEEDKEDIIETGNGKSTLNNISKLTSETVVAEDHLQSRAAFDSESPNQHSQPIDEPIWSGEFKINNEVCVTLAGHISSKACEMVWKLSRSMQPVVEVIKIRRLEAWPDSWRTSRPTDDNIALYFFPLNMRKTNEFDGLVEDIIENDSVLKVVVGIAELLIFSSTILPEQYHMCQGKHYLWGVFKRREDESHKDLVEEQDGSASASDRADIREHHSMDHQYEVQCKSSKSETCVVKHVVQLVDAQEEAMKSGTREGVCSTGGKSSSAKPNTPKDRQDLTKPSGDSGQAATTGDSAQREPEPTPTKLFGVVAARTPRAQQLIQEMINEGALLFSLPEGATTTGSTVINHTR